MKSSRKPTSPSPTNRNSSSRAEARRRRPREQRGHGVAEHHRARMITTPPMVGVPRLVWWRGRAVVADQLAVAALATSSGSRRGVPSRVTSSARPPPSRIALIAASSRAVTVSGRAARVARPRSRPAAARRLDQHDVPRASSPAAARRGLVVGHQHRLLAPRPRSRSGAASCDRRVPPSPTTTSRSTPSRDGQPADRVVLGVGRVAELEHLAEHRHRCGAPRPRPSRPAPAARPHRVGVGVVGVVDDHARRRGARAPPSASGDAGCAVAEQRAATSASGMPSASGHRGGGGAFSTWCSPVSRSRTGTDPAAVCEA